MLGKYFRLLWIFLAVMTSVSAPGYEQSQSCVIRAERILTVSHGNLEPGEVLIENGKIARVGTSVNAPAGAKVVQAKTVIPGLVDMHTHLGVYSLPNVTENQDGNEMTDPLEDTFRGAGSVEDANFNPENAALLVKAGIKVSFKPRDSRTWVTPALSESGEGDLLPWRSAVIRLIDGNLERMLVKFPAGVHATIGEAPKLRYGAKGKLPGTRMGEIALLRQTLVDAQQYMEKRAAAKPAPPADLKLEALAPVLKGELPLIVSPDKREDILAAIRVADEFHLKMILSHGTEAHRVANELASRNIPVLLGPASQAGLRLETMKAQEDTALILHSAGIKLAFQTGAMGNSRELLQQARAAIARGLPQEVALRALTLNAAEILGVSDRLGSLEQGKTGDVSVFEGDPLRTLALPKMVIIGGKVS